MIYNTPLCHLLGLDRQSKRPDSINQLVISTFSNIWLILNCIFQIALMANEHPVLFISIALEGGGWRLIVLKETRFWPLFNFKAVGFGYGKPEMSRSSKSPSWPDYINWCTSCLNWGKWLSNLVNSQLKLDSVVGGGAQDQQKMNNK